MAPWVSCVHWSAIWPKNVTLRVNKNKQKNIKNKQIQRTKHTDKIKILYYARWWYMRDDDTCAIIETRDDKNVKPNKIQG